MPKYHKCNIIRLITVSELNGGVKCNFVGIRENADVFINKIVEGFDTLFGIYDSVSDSLIN